MDGSLRDKGIELLRRGVEEDNKKNFDQALSFYQLGISYLMKAAKYEKNPAMKDTLTTKIREYLSRAEDIRSYLDAVATKKTPIKMDEGGGNSNGEEGETEQQRQLRGALSSCIIKEKPNVRWEDIAGLEAAKDALQEAVIYPLKLSHLFLENRLEPWSGILLYGPPGTGKTQLAKAVATEVDSTFFSVSSADLVNKWVGESERLVKQLFAMARESKPSIIFIDEIDSLCSARTDAEHETSRRIKTEFLAQMAGVGNPMNGVLVLAATNLPWNIDAAIRRRFQRRIYIPLPERAPRAGMFEIFLKNVPNSLRYTDCEALADLTEGYSGSDIRVAVQDARYEAARLLKRANYFRRVPRPESLPGAVAAAAVAEAGDSELWWQPCSEERTEGAVPMTFKQLDETNQLHRVYLAPVSAEDARVALRRSRPSVSPADLERYRQFTEQYGQNAFY